MAETLTDEQIKELERTADRAQLWTDRASIQLVTKTIRALQWELAAEREQKRTLQREILGAFYRAMADTGACPFCGDSQGHEAECVMWSIPDDMLGAPDD